MRHESIGAVHTHTYTHTRINLEEKRVDIIYSINVADKVLVLMHNLIYEFRNRLLFSKRNDYLLGCGLVSISKFS